MALISGTLLIGSPFVYACGADALLQQLKDVKPPLSAVQLDQARTILQAHCAQTRPDNVAHDVHQVAPETDPPVASAAAEPGDDAPPTLFGIEFRKADKNSKGHERLKK